MEDILEKVKKLEGIGPLASIGNDPTIQHDVATLTPYPDIWIHLHIEAQTYLLAEILQEMRKANTPVIAFDFGKHLGIDDRMHGS